MDRWWCWVSQSLVVVTSGARRPKSRLSGSRVHAVPLRWRGSSRAAGRAVRAKPQERARFVVVVVVVTEVVLVRRRPWSRPICGASRSGYGCETGRSGERAACRCSRRIGAAVRLCRRCSWAQASLSRVCLFRREPRMSLPAGIRRPSRGTGRAGVVWTAKGQFRALRFGYLSGRAKGWDGSF